MAVGTVRYFRDGVGFIAPDHGGSYVYVRLSAGEAAAIGGLAEGKRVSFEINREARGSKAMNLRAA